MDVVPEIAPVRAIARKIGGAGFLDRYRVSYEKCRLDVEFPEFVYRTVLLTVSGGAIGSVIGLGCLLAGAGREAGLPQAAALPIAAGIAGLALVFYGRLWAVSSLREYRGALIDAGAVHALGLMLAMAGFNVPLKRIFRNLANLGGVYGEEIALEAAYVLALVEEDGMGIVAALQKAQATSPSMLWQELLIGIASVQSGGGSLKEYLGGRYRSLAEKKLGDIRRYNETVQGMASVYLSVVGIASIFVAIINLVFNMAGMVAGDAFVWIDALVIVPLGSFVVARVLRAAYPEVRQ